MKKIKVTLVGAGGKMGMRLTHNLKNSEYEMSYLEVNPPGIEKLGEKGIKISDPSEVLADADAVIYAVPDVALGKVTGAYIPIMRSGALALTLDPAAALAGKLFDRADIAYFITFFVISRSSGFVRVAWRLISERKLSMNLYAR